MPRLCYFESGKRSVLNDDLAYDIARAVVRDGCLSVVECIDAIDYRPDAMLFHRPAHVLEIPAASNCHRAKPDPAHEHGHEIDATFIHCQDANDGDFSSNSRGLHRLGQSRGATHLDNAIDAAAVGEFAD